MRIGGGGGGEGESVSSSLTSMTGGAVNRSKHRFKDARNWSAEWLRARTMVAIIFCVSPP